MGQALLWAQDFRGKGLGIWASPAFLLQEGVLTLPMALNSALILSLCPLSAGIPHTGLQPCPPMHSEGPGPLNTTLPTLRPGVGGTLTAVPSLDATRRR